MMSLLVPPVRRSGAALAAPSLCTACPLYRTTGVDLRPLARKPNYGFEKRKKELDRKAKKDAKREDRRRREERASDDGAAPPDENGPTTDSVIDDPTPP
jgi:hypothetical protein